MTSRKEVAWVVRGRRIVEVRMTDQKDAALARIIWSFADRHYPVAEVVVNGVGFDISGDIKPAS